MSRKRTFAVIGVAIFTLAAIIVILRALMGEGALQRLYTMSGVYSICKPDDYPVVCFLDADGKDGGMFCMPLSQVGGKCKGGK